MPDQENQPDSRPRFSAIHLWVIITPAMVVFSLLIPEGESVYAFIPGTHDHQCLMRVSTGLSCASCGLTGAFQAIVQGKILLATLRNALSLPLFATFIFFGLIALLDLIGFKDITNKWFDYYKSHWRRIIEISFIIILLFYFTRMLGEIDTGCWKTGGFVRLINNLRFLYPI